MHHGRLKYVQSMILYFFCFCVRLFLWVFSNVEAMFDLDLFYLSTRRRMLLSFIARLSSKQQNKRQIGFLEDITLENVVKESQLQWNIKCQCHDLKVKYVQASFLTKWAALFNLSKVWHKKEKLKISSHPLSLLCAFRNMLQIVISPL